MLGVWRAKPGRLKRGILGGGIPPLGFPREGSPKKECEGGLGAEAPQEKGGSGAREPPQDKAGVRGAEDGKRRILRAALVRLPVANSEAANRHRGLARKPRLATLIACKANAFWRVHRLSMCSNEPAV